MCKLIKMEFYRFFSSKTIRFGVIFACIVAAAYMFFSLGVVKLMEFAGEADPELYTSMMGLDILLSQLSWVGGVDFADVVIAGTGAFSLFIGCMMTASFIGSEQSSKYTKNFAGLLPNRGYTAISKFVVTSAAQILIILIYAIVSAILAVVLLGSHISGYNIGALLGALGLRILLHLAINAVIVFICALAKSHAIAMVVGSIFGIGVTRLVYMIIGMLTSVMKVKFPIGDYMPDGINSQLSASNVGELALKGVFVSLAFIIGFVAINYVMTRKRDVR